MPAGQPLASATCTMGMSFLSGSAMVGFGPSVLGGDGAGPRSVGPTLQPLKSKTEEMNKYFVRMGSPSEWPNAWACRRTIESRRVPRDWPCPPLAVRDHLHSPSVEDATRCVAN